MRVTVIGEKCEDIFVYGDCNRLSPEAPVPVLNPVQTVTNPGMAANVVKNIISIDNTVNVQGFHQQNQIKKTRYVDKKTNHMLIRVDENDIAEPINLNVSTKNTIQNSDIIIVSDYDKGFLSNEDLLFIGSHSKCSILDSKKKLRREIIDSFTFVKMNEVESKQNELLKTLDNVIITLGSVGASYKGVVYTSPKPQETIDVSGAGDTFTSAFILEYYKTKNVGESIIYANKMASIVVSKRGVSTP